MAALTLTAENYYDKVLGAWQGKSAGVTLGQGMRGQMVPGRNNYYSPVPGQPVASVALDFPLVWLATLEECGPEVTPADLAVAWLEHLDYPQDEFGYAALNLRRGVPPPASGAYANWFRHSTGGVLRADLWAMLAPGAPQVAAAYAYHDSKLDHSEEGVWAAMFLAAVGSAAFFLSDSFTLLTIGLAMIPRTCRTARAVKTALAAAGRGASWLEARESVQHEVGHKNFSDAPQNLGFFTIGLLYGVRDFGAALCAGCNCGYDAETVGGAVGAVLGIRDGSIGLPSEWIGPLGDLVIPGNGLRDFDAPRTLTELASRTVALGKEIVAARCPEIAIVSGQSAEGLAAPEIGDLLPSGEAHRTLIEFDAPAETVAAESLTPAETAETEPAQIEPPVLEAENAESISVTPEQSGFTAAFPVVVPQEPVFQPIVEPVASAPPAAPVPQPVTEQESQPLAREPEFRQPEIAPDPANAIAWADSTLVKPLLVTPSNALLGQAGDFEIVLDTGDAPAIAYNTLKTLAFAIYNRGEAFSGRIALLTPPGWQVQAPPALGQRQYIAAHTGLARIEFNVFVPMDAGRIDISNTVSLRLAPEDAGIVQEADFHLMGASCWWTVGTFANFDGEGFDRSYAPEDRPGLGESYVSRNFQSIRWERHSFFEPSLDLEPLFRGGSGVCYGQTTLQSPTGREARIVANTNSGVKVWLNGGLLMRRYNRETFRPQIGAGNWASDVTLRPGGNSLLVKWVRGTEPFEFSLTVSDRTGRGLPEVGNTAW